MKFHLDENVAAAVALGLRRRGVDVTTSKDAALRSASDTEQLAYALQENRVTVTHDSDLLRLASAGVPHADIAFCHNGRYRVGELILKLLALANRVSSDEIHSRIEFL